MRATVFGASSGYVSISIVPLTVSSTRIGPAPGDFCCAATEATASATRTSNAAVSLLITNLARPSSALSDQFSDLRDADLRTDVHQDALRTQRIHRAADVLPPRHEVEIDERPPPPRHGPVERVLGLSRRACLHPPEPV